MREFSSVIWMACKDLRHDARMTTCLVLTVAAIALPLLLFFGLKNGVVEVMRQRMINDPGFMEVIPQGTSTFDAAWFSTWAQNPHVGFVVPKTRELGVAGLFSNEATKKKVRADMQPTGAGDWLLQSYHISIPQEGACVLTASLAHKLGLKKGDSVHVTISRQKKGGGLQSASRTLHVHDVLPQQASGRDMVFVPLIQLERMEAYRDGFGVEAYGWPGEKPLAYPVFYAALLYTKDNIDPITLAQIRQRTGFVRLETTTDYAISGWQAMVLEAGNLPLSLFKLQELRNIMRGKEYAIIPMGGRPSAPLEFSLQNSTGPAKDTMSLQLHSSALWASDTWKALYPSTSQGKKVSPKYWQNVQHSPSVLLVAPSLVAHFPQGQAVVHIQAPAAQAEQGESVQFLMQLQGHEGVAEGTAVAAPGLVARLNLLFTRPLQAQVQHNALAQGAGQGGSPKQGQAVTQATNAPQDISLLLGRQNYSRFRMYARTLDDVAPLAAQLEKEGVIVKTRVADIERVRQMDQYLSLILGLIAGAAVAGGAICLLASLYASVERKRRSLAVLRLLGIHGSSLCAFPLTAGLVMTGLGMLLSLGLFHAISYYMNTLAQDFTLPGEVLCKLGVEHQLWAIMWALLAAMLAGIAAALRLLKIEAAESLRDE